MSLRRGFSKLGALFRRRKPADDLAEEIRAHLSMEEQENLESGMTPEDAHYAALRRFGNVTLAQERSREMWGWNSVETLWQDVRYGLRMLLKNPGFTAVAVVTLALGIGANTAIFTFVNAFLFRPAAIDRPGDTVFVSRGNGGGTSSFADYRQLRDRNTVFSGLAAFLPYGLDVRSATGRQKVFAELVSENYFPVLGVKPALGRTFLPKEDGLVAVVSQVFWKRELHANSDLSRQTITIDNQRFSVIGVVPEDFSGLASPWRTDLWVPLTTEGQIIPLTPHDPGERGVLIIGRLERGFTAQQAQAAMLVLDEQLNHESVREREKLIVQGGSLMQSSPISKALVPVSVVLMVVVGLILLIACANLANLLTVRASLRHCEIAIRLAVGASRGRLIRQLLTEGGVLALLGMVVGILLAYWTGDVLASLIPANISGGFTIDHRLDWRVLGFTLALSSLSVVIFGLRPALAASRSEVLTALRNDGGAALSTKRLRGFLVVAQVASSMTVLILAGLFIRSVIRLQTSSLGFDTSKLLVVELYPPADLNLETERAEYIRQAQQRIQALQGVQSASLTPSIPLGGENDVTELLIQGHAPLRTRRNDVDAEYFSTTGIPLLRGRDFNRHDANAVIINETLARHGFPGEDPIGKRVQIGSGGAPFEIIGVAKDIRYSPLIEAPQPYVYLLNAQVRTRSAFLLVRTIPNPESMVPLIGRETGAYARTAKDYLSPFLQPARSAAALMSVLGILALALAAVGIYGVMAYSTTQRTNEIGLRMALGAAPRDVLRLVIRYGLCLTLVGEAAGLIAAFGVSHLATSLLYGLQPADPVTFGVVALALSSVGMIANYVPARRATKVDAMVALRYE
jgi:predicted permease